MRFLQGAVPFPGGRWTESLRISVGTMLVQVSASVDHLLRRAMVGCSEPPPHLTGFLLGSWNLRRAPFTKSTMRSKFPDGLS